MHLLLVAEMSLRPIETIVRYKDNYYRFSGLFGNSNKNCGSNKRDNDLQDSIVYNQIGYEYGSGKKSIPVSKKPLTGNVIDSSV